MKWRVKSCSFFSDPGVGPVDDSGCHVQIPSTTSFDDLVFDDDDECDSMQRHHLPTMSDMLIAFPSQKGTFFFLACSTVFIVIL
jgi:hypothetical protein